MKARAESIESGPRPLDPTHLTARAPRVAGRIAATALLAWTSVAHADDVGVIVTGDAASQPRIEALAEDWLRTNGRTLAVSVLSPDALDSLIDCYAIDDQPCAARVVDASATASAVVFIHVDVEAQDGARTITMRGHWLAKGHAPLTELRTCEACTDATLRTTATELISALNGRVAPPAPVLTAPVLTTPPAPRPSRTLPYALVGGGAALLVTGITLIALSENDTGDSYHYYDGRNRTAGIVLGTLGVAAASAGAYLYVRATRSTDSAPSVALLPGGAYVGWARSF